MKFDKMSNWDFVYAKNVKEYAKEISKELETVYSKDFMCNIERNLDDYSTSPIESLFYLAYKYFSEMTKISYPDDKWCLEERIKLIPQYEINNYRCDFLLIEKKYADDLENIENLSNITKIIVELDGHNFHDRNEKERRYEKERDRYLQSKGFTVLRFTGKEVCEDPKSVFLKCVTYPNPDCVTMHSFSGLCMGYLSLGELDDIAEFFDNSPKEKQSKV